MAMLLQCMPFLARRFREQRPANYIAPPKCGKDISTLLGLDWPVIADMVAPYSIVSEMKAFALAARDIRRAFISDDLWQARLIENHRSVLSEFCTSVESLPRCLRLCVRFEAVLHPVEPLLRKPKNTLLGWELHEHKAWTVGVAQWKLERLREETLLFLQATFGVNGRCPSGEPYPQALERVRYALEDAEAELAALQILCAKDTRPEHVFSRAVQLALERKREARGAAQREQLRWLREDLQGPLLAPEGATRFSG
eukprot:TRINITY_DN7973_c0_g2_i1.p1 TRINITY_DN7973_c0_g2~~TRINITY_DN7973_c0_g2_i1.p1  ORF type:complete len:255 (-),score=44.69 TRINITY_DN7973_c0_g2_i1:97-861(-)